MHVVCGVSRESDSNTSRAATSQNKGTQHGGGCWDAPSWTNKRDGWRATGRIELALTAPWIRRTAHCTSSLHVRAHYLILLHHAPSPPHPYHSPSSPCPGATLPKEPCTKPIVFQRSSTQSYTGVSPRALAQLALPKVQSLTSTL